MVGNAATFTIYYYVVPGIQIQFGGILPPVNADGSSIFKLGRTVPVKFRLFNSDGSFITTAVARLYASKINDAVTGTEVEVVSTSAATEGNLFRYDNLENQYIFNLNTASFSRGTWQLRIEIEGETSHYVTISLR